MTDALYIVCEIPHNPQPHSIIEIDWNSKPKYFVCPRIASYKIEDTWNIPRWSAINFKNGTKFNFSFLPSYAKITRLSSIEFLDFLIQQSDIKSWKFTEFNGEFLEIFGKLMLIEMCRTIDHIQSTQNKQLYDIFKQKFFKSYVPWVYEFIKTAHAQHCGTYMFQDCIVEVGKMLEKMTF